MKWIRTKIRKWLGLAELEDAMTVAALELEEAHIKLDAIRDLVHVGVDVHFKEPHMVLIYSKLNGGQIRHIPVGIENLAELRSMVEEIKARYHTQEVIWDAPTSIKGFF